ncbi:MAG: hypothetical protein U9R15_00185 [Chloroflexota bacterium]|nr:hypothetical protein [Chloroflexota bacterium]
MMAEKWIVHDRYGNEIYLTAERWDHILEYHPELEGCLDHVLNTLKKGRRKQEPTMPHKYRYYRRCDELLPDHNHVVVIVIFSVRQRSDGTPNNFVTTAWPADILGLER